MSIPTVMAIMSDDTQMLTITHQHNPPQHYYHQNHTHGTNTTGVRIYAAYYAKYVIWRIARANMNPGFLWQQYDLH